MGTGYTRNDSANNIADGNVINASDLDGEFDAVQAAFNASTGHSHDGTTGEGPKIDTAGLADDAVTGAKIDSTTTITAAGFTGPLTGTASNAALLDNIDSTSFLRSDAADTKTSGDLSFSDNVKATFGAGSDLQIFSDGTHGIIKESGSGDLLIYGNNLRLGNADGSELYILGNNNAEVQLRYDNATKLATTATGTNTTGISVATDTVGSSFNQFYALGNGNVGGIRFGNTTKTNGYIYYDNGGNMNFHADGPERMRIDSSGRVGIGTSSPDFKAEIVGGTNDGLHIKDAESATVFGGLFTQSANLALVARSNHALTFGTNDAERMRIDSSGNLLVGTTTGGGTIGTYNGFGAFAGGSIFSAATSNRSIFSRRSTDGSIIEFRKDSTGVGVIGTQNWGIGTSNPAGPLEVHKSGGDANVFITTGVTTSSTTILFGDSASDDRGRVHYDHNNDSMRLHTAGSERMRITSAGNVGVGTASPERALHVEGAGLIKNTSGEALFKLQAANNSNSILELADTNDGNVGRVQYEHDNNAMLLYTNDSERMRIDSSGRVGIGTASPSSILHTSVSSGANKLIVQNTAASGQSVLQLNTDSTTPGQCQIYMGKTSAPTNGQVGYDPNNDFLYLYTNNSERMRITSAGNVGIGSSSAIEKLRVSGNVELYNDNTDGYIWFHDTGTRSWSIGSDQSTGNFAITNVQGLASGHKVQINGSGDFLVGTNGISIGSPGNSETGLDVTQGGVAQLSATGIALFLRRTGGNGDLVRFHAGTGAGGAGSISVTTTSTSYNTSSDHRLKENITDISNAIDRVKILAPKRFNFIADADTTVDGFLAHEAQAVVPEAVTGTHNEVDEDGNAIMQGIDQSKFVPLLTAALKEAITKIEDLETRLAALEAN
jgi:hypothetical protein